MNFPGSFKCQIKQSIKNQVQSRMGYKCVILNCRFILFLFSFNYHYIKIVLFSVSLPLSLECGCQYSRKGVYHLCIPALYICVDLLLHQVLYRYWGLFPTNPPKKPKKQKSCNSIRKKEETVINQIFCGVDIDNIYPHSGYFPTSLQERDRRFKVAGLTQGEIRRK